MWDAINRMGGSSPMMGMGAFGGQVNPEQKYMEALQKYQNAPEEKKAEALAKLIIAIERLTEFQQNQGQPNMGIANGGNSPFGGINLNQDNRMSTQGTFSMMG